MFARHRTMQGILAKVLQEEFQLPVRIINGETKLRGGSLNASGVRTRNAILQDFRVKPGFNVLILSPFVAGIGLTIVEANHVVHYGRWWNPAVESQATDRAYRIGQTKEVSVYLPILRDPSGRVAPTFDERLDLLMEETAAGRRFLASVTTRRRDWRRTDQRSAERSRPAGIIGCVGNSSSHARVPRCAAVELTSQVHVSGNIAR